MSGSRRRQLVVGAVVLVGCLVAGAVLWVIGGQRRDDAVADLARAPVGCDTTLDFDRAGEFLVFVETRGTLDDIAGDCGAPGPYDLDGEEPEVRLTLRDADGVEVDLDPARGIEYDSGGYTGELERRVTIAEPGDHVLTVESDTDAVFAVAVGRDPNDGVTLLRWAALGAVIAGLLVGGLLLVLGSRRSGVSSGPEEPWRPDAGSDAGWPVGPPGFPPPPPTTGASAPGGRPPWSTSPPSPPTASPPSSLPVSPPPVSPPASPPDRPGGPPREPPTGEPPSVWAPPRADPS